MFCPNCGKEILKETNFCRRCGTDLSKTKKRNIQEFSPGQIPNDNKTGSNTLKKEAALVNRREWMMKAVSVILRILGLYAIILGLHFASGEKFIPGFKRIPFLEGITRGFLLPLAALPDTESIAESVVGPYCILIGASIITLAEFIGKRRWTRIVVIVLCIIGILGGLNTIIGAVLPALALFFILKS